MPPLCYRFPLSVGCRLSLSILFRVFFDIVLLQKAQKKISYDTQISHDTLKTRDTIMCIVDTPRNPIQSTIHIVLASRHYVSYDTYRASYNNDYTTQNYKWDEGYELNEYLCVRQWENPGQEPEPKS